MDLSLQYILIHLNQSGQLRVVFMLYWILILMLTIFVLLYFNRLMGCLVTYMLDVVVWRMYRVKISVQSVKVSFLGGKVLFRNLTVVTQDGILCLTRGSVKWRYWLVRTRDSEYSNTINHRSPRKKNALPSRFVVEVDGLEVFVFNRSMAFEAALDMVSEDSSESFEVSSQTPLIKVSPLAKHLRSLPIEVLVKKGAIIFGNHTTPTLLTLSFLTADGDIDIATANSPLDLYRFVFSYKLHTFDAFMKTNPTYNSEPLHEKANAIHSATVRRNIKMKRALRSFFRLTPVRALFLRASVQPAPGQKWRGLRQYMEMGDYTPGQDIPAGRADEYAKVSNLVTAEMCEVVYYYDIPGPGPFGHANGLEDQGSGFAQMSDEASSQANRPAQENVSDKTNPSAQASHPGPAFGTDLDPLTGIDIILSRATVNYGPWANKQRAALQSMLLPTVCRDTQLTTPLMRTYSGFKIFMEVHDELIFRVPFREPSKERANVRDDVSASPSRPFGWIELKVDEFSTMTFDTSYIPTASGWANRFQVTLSEPELRTSINHDILFKADKHLVTGDCGYPLAWNGDVKWSFTNESHNAEIFVLREHVALLSDMSSDFAGGDPVSYEMFRPFVYELRWAIVNGYGIYMNVNDGNIINNPLDFGDNCFLLFAGSSITLDAVLPMDQVYAKSTTIEYDIHTPMFDLRLLTPPWNTINGFLGDNKVARAHNFGISGSYTYHSAVEINMVDTIVIAFCGDEVTLVCYGFLVRYFMIIMENYFGASTHFKTLQEYHTSMAARPESGGPGNLPKDLPGAPVVPPAVPPVALRVENEIDVWFSFSVNRGSIVLPSFIYNCASHVALRFDSLDIDIRFTNYYMDLQADFSPITSHFVQCDPLAIFAMINELFHPEMTIAGAAIHAHRMFGLPPLEPTYFCKWDFDFGAIAIDSRPSFFKGLLDSVAAVAFGYEDSENSLVLDLATIHDMTYVSFNCPKAEISLADPEGNGAVVVSLQPLAFTFNDIANARYSDLVDLQVPAIAVKVIDATGNIIGGLETSIHLSNFCQKREFEKTRDLQQQHVRLHDGPFHRCPFVLAEMYRDEGYNAAYGSIVPSVSFPELSIPLNEETSDDFLDEALEGISGAASGAPSVTSGETSDESFSGQSFFPKTHMFGSNLPPINDYLDYDFSPAAKPDPAYEYDSVVVNLGAVLGFISISSLPMLLNLVKAFEVHDIESVMDNLQIDVIKRLQSFLKVNSSVKNTRFITSLVLLRLGEFTFPTMAEALASPNGEGVYIFLENPSLVSSFKTIRIPDKPMGAPDSMASEFTCAVHLKEVLVEIQGSDEWSKAVALRVADLELWCDKTAGIIDPGEVWRDEASVGLETSGLNFQLNSRLGNAFRRTIRPSPSRNPSIAASIRLRTCKLLLVSHRMKWLGSFLHALMGDLSALQREAGRALRSSNDREVELLLKVAAASRAVVHDSAVITKPAYIIRVSKDHVRSNDSWRVITRLRHVLHTLPRTWHATVNQSLQENTWIPPPDVAARVLEIFADWRSWEFVDINNSYVFSHVFPTVFTRKVSETLDWRVSTSVEDFAIRMVSENAEDDFVNLGYWDMYTTGEMKDMIEVSVEMKLESYRSKVSTMLVVVRELIEEIAKAGTDGSRVEPDKSKTVPETDNIKVTPEVLGPLEVPLASVSSPSRPLSLSFTCLVDNCEQYLDLGSGLAVLSATTRGWSINSQARIEPLTSPITLSMKVDSTDVGLLYGGLRMFSSKVTDTTLVVANVGPLIGGSRLVDIEMMDVDLSSDSGVGPFLQLITELLEAEREVIMSFMSEKVEPSDLPSESTLASKSSQLIPATSKRAPEALASLLVNLGIIDFTSRIRHFNSKVKMVSHLGQVYVSDAALKVRLDQETVAVSSRFKVLVIGLLSAETTVWRSENKDFETLASVAIAETVSLRVLLQSGAFEVFFPHPTVLGESLFSIQSDAVALKGQTEVIRETIKAFGGNHGNTNPGKHGSTVLFNIHAVHNHIGITTKSLDQRVKLEVSRINLQASNGSHTTKSLVPVYGSLSLAAKLFASSQTVLDMGFHLRVLNPVQSSESALQTLQVESEHCRVFLSPIIVALFVEMGGSMAALVPKPAEEPASSFAESGSDFMAIETIMSFYAIQILCYNFCFGWSFGDAAEMAYPGINFGCERVFAVTEKGLGKLTLMKAYVSVARGSHSDDFYPILAELDALNRAFLPKVQVVVVRTKDGIGRDINIRVTGEKLDVKFSSTSIRLVENLLKSIALVTDLVTDLLPKPAPMPIRSEEVDYMEALGSKFTSIQCMMSFAGGTFLLYVPLDEQTAPTLSLQSPPVKILLLYNKVSGGIKKHVVNLQVLASSSDNTVYSSCVPVLMDIYRNAIEMVKMELITKLPEGELVAKQTVKPHESIKEVDKRSDPKKETSEKANGNHGDSNSTTRGASKSSSRETLGYKSGSTQTSNGSGNGHIQNIPPEPLQPISNTPRPIPAPLDSSEFSGPLGTSSVDSVSGLPDTRNPNPDDRNSTQSQIIRLLKDTDFHLGVRIASQRLSLSCEPTAKVEAIVGIGLINLEVMNSPDGAQLGGSVKINALTASLQHIFSRQVSALISVDQLSLTSLMGLRIQSFATAGSLSAVRTYVNFKQLQDVHLFVDIWMPVTPNGPPKTVSRTLALRFREVSATQTFPWVVNFVIMDVLVEVDLGQSLGIVTLLLDQFWLVSRRKVDWSQSMKLGVQSVSLASKGRLSGGVVLKDIGVHSAISWTLGTEILDIPLVKLSVSLGSLQVKTAFDYHSFLIANVENLSIHVFNQRSGMMDDRLAVVGNCDTIEAYVTALAASNLLDITNTLQQIVSDSKTSYSEVLRDSASAPMEEEIAKPEGPLIFRLKTVFAVSVHQLVLQVYPSSLLDPQVLVVKLADSNALFKQVFYENRMKDTLTLRVLDVSVAVSSFKKQRPEDDINRLSVSEFVKHSRGAQGGTIFVFPAVEVAMTTFQTPESNRVGYLFRSVFDGKVDVRWNLGSVNFIREMGAVHYKAIESRMARDYTTNFDSKDLSLSRDESFIPAPTTTDPDLPLPTSTLDRVKYVYEALEPPIINSPQLKELGNATPPLEWFGVHRGEFPSVTHRVIIVALQKIVAEAEARYTKTLGKA
ncbi:hypothetical protein BABINDRAFT_159609 [Babjeviella inositovora NRRL Y-12698]|uniref:Protein CSF1 n=1 Tax=Babjeviella inositovora NRRL Y-12698 TaxID=984486 RepID=A0A1E3R032_9ASCO|nr:uncharacterized protein BABINDRAFT_159609 [Babjeviella inositovora NRRL Y-12698]ODQ83164.1 hypothetical protein BABINDRAFT_159609 [Babjeviella inositovora NRRL Y-12698]